MKIIQKKIDMLFLNTEAENKRIWEVMLPEIRKHLSGEPSIFDGIQCPRQHEGYSETGKALVESAVIAPCLEEFQELSDRGAYTFEWTERDSREFSESIQARWSNLMWLINEAMKGTLNDNLAFNDEAQERDYKVVRFLCGDLEKIDDEYFCEGTTGKEDLPNLPF